MKILKTMLMNVLGQSPQLNSARALYSKFGIDVDQKLFGVSGGLNGLQGINGQLNPNATPFAAQLTPPTPPTPPSDPNDAAAQKAYNDALTLYNQNFQAYQAKLLSTMMQRMMMMQQQMLMAQRSSSSSASASTAVSSSSSSYSLGL